MDTYFSISIHNYKLWMKSLDECCFLWAVTEWRYFALCLGSRNWTTSRFSRRKLTTRVGWVTIWSTRRRPNKRAAADRRVHHEVLLYAALQGVRRSFYPSFTFVISFTFSFELNTEREMHDSFFLSRFLQFVCGKCLFVSNQLTDVFFLLLFLMKFHPNITFLIQLIKKKFLTGNVLSFKYFYFSNTYSTNNNNTNIFFNVFSTQTINKVTVNSFLATISMYTEAI